MHAAGQLLCSHRCRAVQRPGSQQASSSCHRPCRGASTAQQLALPNLLQDSSLVAAARPELYAPATVP